MKIDILNFIVFILLTILLVFGIYGIISSINNTNKFNEWANKCLQDGGINSLTGDHVFSQQYECIKDGKIINHVD